MDTLRERYQKLVAQMRAIHDKVEREKRNYTDVEDAEYRRLKEAAEHLQPQIERDRMLTESESILYRTQEEPSTRKTPGDSLAHGSDGWYDTRDTAANVAENPLNVRAYRFNEPLKPATPYQLPSGIRAQDLSLARIIKGKITGDWRGADVELRVMGEGTGSLGGFFVPDAISSMVIDLARAKSVTQRAGVRTIVMTGPEMAIGRAKTDPVGYWRAENADITESDATWDRVLLIAKSLGILVRTSLELLADATNLENLIRGQLAAAIATQLDAICLVGDGVGKPLGILACDGVNEILMGANGAVLSDYDPFSKGVQAILEANGPSEGLAVIHSPRTWGQLDRLKETTTGSPLRAPTSYANMLAFATTSIPTNLTKGSGTNCSTSVIGDWQWLMLGMLGPIQIEASRQAGTAFEKGQVLIRALLRCDSAIVRPDHFSKVTGLKQ